MIFVIAGTYREAKDWAHRHGLSGGQVEYVFDYKCLRGKWVHQDDVIYVGSWKTRKDLGLVQKALSILLDMCSRETA